MTKDYKKLHWTEHAKLKMKQYGLSKTKLINLLYKPERKEEGIVPSTLAVMQTNKKYSHGRIRIPEQSLKGGARLRYSYAKKSPGEIWLMYKDVKDLRKVISAWRYPGVSKPGETIPIPEDIKNELLRDTIL